MAAHAPKSLPLINILHQTYPIYVTPSYLLKIHFNAIFLTPPTISKQSLSSGFSTQISYAFLFAPMHVTCPAHLIHLNLFTLELCPYYHIPFLKLLKLVTTTPDSQYFSQTLWSRSKHHLSCADNLTNKQTNKKATETHNLTLKV